MKLIITGGGTGGHLSIAKAVLEVAFKKDIECIYIGSILGQDRAWFENESKFSHKYFLESKGIVNKKGLTKIKALFDILKLSFKAKRIIKEHKANAVFSVGGYSAAPAAFGAIFSSTPLFIHEQNSKKGALNSLLKPFSRTFFSSFESTLCPYPVKECFFSKARIRTKLQTIIFLGGSQGASFINALALKLAPRLDEMGVKIIHQCGDKEFQNCLKEYEKQGIKADVFAFSKELDEKMQKADLAISRAGASTLFELCANALPGIFIPYPSAAKNHQYFNAKFLHDKNLCQIFTQDQAKDEKLVLQSIQKLNLELISNGLKDITQTNGAEFLLETMLQNI